MRVASDTTPHRRYATEWIYGRTGGDVRRSLGAAAGEAAAGSAGVHKLTDDARVTPVGRWLRRLSLDELPQLWNVIRGDMSVIGPRPTLRYQVERYDAHQRRRLDVKPGITGWAQIHGRAELPWADRIELDVWYVEHRSPMLDLKILLKTVPAVLTGRGAR